MHKTSVLYSAGSTWLSWEQCFPVFHLLCDSGLGLAQKRNLHIWKMEVGSSHYSLKVTVVKCGNGGHRVSKWVPTCPAFLHFVNMSSSWLLTLLQFQMWFLGWSKTAYPPAAIDVANAFFSMPISKDHQKQLSDPADPIVLGASWQRCITEHVANLCEWIIV